jgi:hypothetical protein
MQRKLENSQKQCPTVRVKFVLHHYVLGVTLPLTAGSLLRMLTQRSWIHSVK